MLAIIKVFKKDKHAKVYNQAKELDQLIDDNKNKYYMQHFLF